MKILKQFKKVDKWMEDEIPAVASYCYNHTCDACKFSDSKGIICKPILAISAYTGLSYHEILPPSSWCNDLVSEAPVGADTFKLLPIRNKEDLIKIVKDEWGLPKN